MIPVARPGVADFFEGLMVPVPGGRVNAHGGNLYIQRRDISVDTLIGQWGVGAAWNSTSSDWRWNFNLTLHISPEYRTKKFTDETGYVHLAGTSGNYPDYKPIPGSHWANYGASAVRTAGGLIYHFDAAGKLSSANWVSAEYPKLQFVRVSGRVNSIEQCESEGECSTLYTMTYDETGRRVRSIVDLAGRTALYTYDGDSRRIASVRDPLDVANGWPGTRYGYDEEGRLTAVTNSHDERVEYEYYASMTAVRYVRQIGEGDPLWTFVYGGLNDFGTARTSLVDPVGGEMEYVYDHRMRQWGLTNPAGDNWKWKWFGDSRVRAYERTPAGVERYFEVLGEDASTELLPSGNLITYTYAALPAENRADPYARAVLQIEDDFGLIESRTYSATGVLQSISLGTGDTTTYTYDELGDLTVTDPANIQTVYKNRGPHGHYQGVTRGAKTVNYSFDVVGNLTQSDGLLDEDADLGALSLGQGGIIARDYDADRNISALTLEDAGLGAAGLVNDVLIGWRADHRPVLVQRPYGGDSEFLYDALGRAVEERTRVDGSWKRTFSEYDANGRITALLKPNGMASRWSYGGGGQVIKIERERDWTDPLEREGSVEFEYVADRLVEIRDTAHEMVPEEYLYNGNGRIREVRYPGGESITLARDLRGRVQKKEFWQSGSLLLRTFEYEYDLANRRVEVREDGIPLVDVTFADGRVEANTYGNGVEIVNFYDEATGALTGFTANNPLEQVVAEMYVAKTSCSLLLPASDCRTERTDTFRGLVSTSYAEYQLEDQGSERLIADSYGNLFPVDSFYTYDELSNIQQSELGTFVYNAERNRLLEIQDAGAPVVEYVYDEAGFVVERNGVSITWNSMGLVRSVGTELTVFWDSLGRRVSATSEGVERHWKFAGELSEDALGSDQEIDLGWVVCHLDDSTHEYRVFDFRGNAKLLLDDSGDVTAHHHYNGYERVGVGGGSESDADIGFSGGTHLDAFVLLGARVYDPAARRFLSQDPIFQFVNQYAYTLGNPVRFWDPSGAEQWTIVGKEVTTQTAGTTVSGTIECCFGAGVKIEYTINTPGESTTVSMVPTVQTTTEVKVSGTGETTTTTTTTTRSAPAVTSKKSGSEAAFDPVQQGGGSAGRNKDGPNRPVKPKKDAAASLGQGGTGSGGVGASICGLGFELVPIMLTCFALRNRRRGAGEGATSN